MTHLTSIASRITILNFQVPRGQILRKLGRKFLSSCCQKWESRNLLDIWQGGVSYVDLLCIYKVGGVVLICLPPVFGCLFLHWWKWGEGGMMVVLCCGVLGGTGEYG